MQFLALVRRRTESFTSEQFAALLDAEAEHVRARYAEAVLRTVYSRGDVAGAVLFIEADDEATARGVLAALPLAAAGMLEIERVVPLLPYRGFAPRG